jgi:16S rRNA processing protein RimM
MDNDEVVIVGSIGSPFGVRGWVHVKSFTDPADNLARYKPWRLKVQGRWQVRHPTQIKIHGSGLVAVFAGVSGRDQAMTLTGCELGVGRAALPDAEPDEYYWRDLEGLSVFNQSGERLGTVARIMDTGAHVVLVVSGETGETLIPFVAKHVSAVDVAQNRVDVDWLEPE